MRGLARLLWLPLLAWAQPAAEVSPLLFVSFLARSAP